jgi:phosphoribosyl 1,2-cyclic phosphate phosphodiesterase
MLGVHYPPAFLANPKNHRTRASILFQGPTGNLLVDCSPEMRIQLTRAEIYDLEAVLITHTHADHVMGMDDLRSLCIKTGEAVPVYSLPRYHDDIRRIYPYAFQEFPAGVFVPRFDLRPVAPVLEVGGMRVTTFEVIHGKIPVIGVRIGNLAYVTDVSDIPEAAWNCLQGLDTLILDAVRREPHPNHFHLDLAISVAQKLGPKRTILTHLGHDYDHDVTSAELPHGIELGFDGLRLSC